MLPIPAGKADTAVPAASENTLNSVPVVPAVSVNTTASESPAAVARTAATAAGAAETAQEQQNISGFYLISIASFIFLFLGCTKSHEKPLLIYRMFARDLLQPRKPMQKGELHVSNPAEAPVVFSHYALTIFEHLKERLT